MKTSLRDALIFAAVAVGGFALGAWGLPALFGLV